MNEEALAWLLEPDAANPGVRLLALRDLLDRPAADAEVVAAQAAVMTSGPVPVILNAQHPDGYWQAPGGGYLKYRGTAWQIIFLGELGADPHDQRVQHGCAYLPVTPSPPIAGSRAVTPARRRAASSTA